MPQVTREQLPSPPTQSLVTFLGLLLAFGEMVQTCEELDLMVQAMAPTWPWEQLAYEMEPETRCAWQQPSLMISEAGAPSMSKAMLVGTDARGFRTPPDGNGGSRAPSGTDERCFWRHRDLGARCFSTRQTIEMKMVMTGADVRGFAGVAGTHVQQFCGPPNLRSLDAGFDVVRLRTAWTGATRALTVSPMADVAGTDVRGFRRPPDLAGDVLQTGLLLCMDPSGTKVCSFQVPPDG